MTNHVDWGSVGHSVDRINEHQRDQDKDLDETRRLLYMALLASRTKRYNLAGTLANALIHHHGIIHEGDMLMDRIVRLVDGDSSDEDLTWMYQQIERISGGEGNA